MPPGHNCSGTQAVAVAYCSSHNKAAVADDDAAAAVGLADLRGRSAVGPGRRSRCSRRCSPRAATPPWSPGVLSKWQWVARSRLGRLGVL